MNDRSGKQLQREWIDYDLAKKIGQLVLRHTQKNYNENLVGVQIATQALSLVAAVTSLELPPEVRNVIMNDVLRFIIDLASKGWDKDEAQKRKRPN